MFSESPSTFRSYLNLVEKSGELKRETGEVNAKFEIAAIHMKVQAEKGPALLFENVKGFDMPVLVNMLSTRKRLAMGLGLPADVTFEKLNEELVKRVRKEVEPVVLETGPCKEVVVGEDEVDLTRFPIVTMHEKDAGPYLTGGFVVARDPETGEQNMSFHRFLLKGKNKFGIQISETAHGHYIMQKNLRNGKPTPMAVAIGLHPTVELGFLSFTG
ncbi:MAG: UbiD family decarboxylase, partial [Nitrososphaerota archaeon]|nr:UbiD family decarboxylase [Nitrososphaerota archaeon]